MDNKRSDDANGSGKGQNDKKEVVIPEALSEEEKEEGLENDSDESISYLKYFDLGKASEVKKDKRCENKLIQQSEPIEELKINGCLYKDSVSLKNPSSEEKSPMIKEEQERQRLRQKRIEENRRIEQQYIKNIAEQVKLIEARKAAAMKEKADKAERKAAKKIQAQIDQLMAKYDQGTNGQAANSANLDGN